MTDLSADTLPLLRAVGSLAGVLLLAAAVLWLLRRYAVTPLEGRRSGSRLGIVASQVIDGRVRLVLLRRDGTEHLLAITPAGVTVIETLAATNAAGTEGAPRC